MKCINHSQYLIRLATLLCLAFVFNINDSEAQEIQESKYGKNAIHVSAGSIYFASQVSLAYERNVYHNTKYDLRVNVKGVYGHYLNNDLDYDTDAEVYNNYKGLSGVLMSRIFELNFGFAHVNYNLESGDQPDPDIDYTKDRNGIRRYGSFGLRFEKDGFLLRVGLGYPELVYAGIGFSF